MAASTPQDLGFVVQCTVNQTIYQLSIHLFLKKYETSTYMQNTIGRDQTAYHYTFCYCNSVEKKEGLTDQKGSSGFYAHAGGNREAPD